MNSTTEMSVFADRNSKESKAITLILTTVFVGFVPYALLLVLYYITRRTDNRQPHSPIQNTLIYLSGVCVFGSMLLAIVTLLLHSSQPVFQETILQGFGEFCYQSFLNLLVTAPSIIATSYYYILFLAAFQRAVLIAKAKIGMRLMTGRRLKLKITLLFILAVISSINKIKDSTRTPWLEISTQTLTILIFLFSLFMVQHIERRMIALAHITVLAQTVPLALFMSVFTIGDFYVMRSDQKFITLRTFRSLTAFIMSFITPFFLIFGSWAKRRLVMSLITCQWEERMGRGELYTAERTIESSNAVSMVPAPVRF